MSIFSKLLKSNFLMYLALLVWGLLLYFPSLKLNFSLIDDGQMVLVARQVWDRLSNLDLPSLGGLLFEPEVGRVRPAYWIIQSIIAVLGFYNSHLIHFFRLVVLAVTIVLMCRFMAAMGIRKVWIFFGLFFYMSDSLIFENYYRLGPTEPFLAVYFLLTLFFVFYGERRKFTYFVLALVSILGSFTKETYFLVSIPIILIALLGIKTKLVKEIDLKKLFLTSAVLITCGLIVFFIKQSYGDVGGYASQYHTDISRIWANLINYKNQIFFYHTPLIQISLFMLVFNLYFFLKNGIKFFDLIYLFLWFGVFVQLALLLPWRFPLGRYLILTDIQLSFIYSITLFKAYEFLLKYLALKQTSRKKYARVIDLALLFVFTPFFLTRNIFPIANFQLWQKTDSEFTTSLLNAISTTVPNNNEVYANFQKGDSNIEIFLEIPWHLKLFWNREDVNLIYIDETNLCTASPRYILDRRSDRFVDAKTFQDQDNFTLIDSGKNLYKPLNYGVVRDSFIKRTKLKGWNDEHVFDWSIYIQKGNTCVPYEDKN